MGKVGAFLDEVYNSISKMDFKQEVKEAIFLKNVKTCDLVKELSEREGVEKLQIEPYKKINIKAEGPIIILKVID